MDNTRSTGAQSRGSVDTDVAIVGGGWSGLATAVTLADAGLSVAVFEASQTLGGRARRVAVDTMSVDNGQHLLLGAYRDTLRLIERVHEGRSGPPLYLRIPLHLAGPGRFALRARDLPAPFHMLAALAFARDCSIGERIALVRAFARWKRARWKTDPAATVARLLDDQPESMVRRIWSPLCLAALNTPIEAASAQVYLDVLRDALASDRRAGDLVIPLVDLSSLFPEAAARVVEAAGGVVRRGARVRQFARAGAAIAITIDGVPAVHRTRAVVVATAPWQAIALLEREPSAQEAVAAMRRYRYQPICTVYLRFDEPIALDVPMLQLDGAPGQWLFAPDPGDDLAQIVAVVISADGPYRALAREVLVQRICAQLDRNLPGWKSRPPVASQVIVERRATHAAVPLRAVPEAGRLSRGIHLAGDHTDPDYPATLEAACRSGIRAARSVLAERGGARGRSGT